MLKHSLQYTVALATQNRGEVLINIEGNINIFMPQAFLHILYGCAMLNQHSGVCMPEAVIIKFRNVKLLLNHIGSVLHSTQINIGAILADTDKVYRSTEAKAVSNLYS